MPLIRWHCACKFAHKQNEIRIPRFYHEASPPQFFLLQYFYEYFKLMHCFASQSSLNIIIYSLASLLGVKDTGDKHSLPEVPCVQTPQEKETLIFSTRLLLKI